jgi:hypothetical protein
VSDQQSGPRAAVDGVLEDVKGKAAAPRTVARQCATFRIAMYAPPNTAMHMTPKSMPVSAMRTTIWAIDAVARGIAG